jgi:Transposase DDE domain
MASELSTNDVHDGSQIGPLLDQVTGPVASLTGDGAYDRDDVYGTIAERHPGAAVVVPPRATAVPSETANTAPAQRDRHLQQIAERGRLRRGYTRRALVEAAISRYSRVIGDALRSRTHHRQATEIAVAANALNRMLEFGRPRLARIK